jgi:hypothetical protein
VYSVFISLKLITKENVKLNKEQMERANGWITIELIMDKEQLQLYRINR